MAGSVKPLTVKTVLEQLACETVTLAVPVLVRVALRVCD